MIMVLQIERGCVMMMCCDVLRSPQKKREGAGMGAKEEYGMVHQEYIIKDGSCTGLLFVRIRLPLTQRTVLRGIK